MAAICGLNSGMGRARAADGPCLPGPDGSGVPLLDLLEIGVLLTDPKDRIVYANPAAMALCGMEQAVLDGAGFFPLRPGLPKYLGYIYRSARESLQPQAFDRFEQEVCGQTRHCSGWVRPLAAGGRYAGMVCTFADVTAAVRSEARLLEAQAELESVIEARTAELARVNRELQAEMELRTRDAEAVRAANERFRLLFESAAEGIGRMTPDGMLLEANAAMAHILGYPTPGELCRAMADASRQLFVEERLWQRVVGLLRAEGRVRRVEAQAVTRDGEPIWVEMSAYLTESRWGQERIEILMADVSGRKAREQALYQQATVDPLTGVPNRSILLDRLGQTHGKARRYRETFALLFIDLDNFKVVNDNYGHRVGDEVLARAAALIQGQVRGSDTLARFGGDEFCVILNNLAREEAACAVAAAIIEKVRAPMDIDGITAEVGASIGIAAWRPGSEATAEELLLQADAAMYRAKHEGGNRYVIHGLPEGEDLAEP